MLSFMPEYYHDSVNKSNTEAIHICDVVAAMENTGEMTAGQRLKMARKQAQMTQHQLAAAAKVAQSAIGNIEAGSRGFGSSVIQIARALNVSPDWLATGDGEMRGITAAGSMALPAIIGSGVASNVVPIASSVKVPLVSWVQAGAPSEIREPDPYTEWTKKSWVQAWHSAPSRFAFALRVEGDSMTSPYPNQLSFPEGTLLIG